MNFELVSCLPSYRIQMLINRNFTEMLLEEHSS